jgi:hypothetical protein
MFCMVEHMVETFLKVMIDNVCNEIQVHHTCIDYGVGVTLYMLVPVTSLALVLACVCK